MKIIHALILLLTIVALSPIAVLSQTHSSDAYTYFMNPDNLQRNIRILISDSLAGRAMGSQGGEKCAMYIESKFQEAGLEPYKGEFLQQFIANGKRGINVVGKVSSTVRSYEYIIIGAHYDHKGIINGNMYRGADDNASGTAGLIALAEAFAKMKRDGQKIDKNIIFVAFDGKEMSMCGSKFFAAYSYLPANKVTSMINIDQIGTTLSPPNKKNEYIIAIGAEKLKEWEEKQLSFCNTANNLNLDIDYSFYNSENFRDLFYMLSDQYSFAERGIPAILFTAGINNHTNKISDTEAIIDYNVLSKRIMLIYYFIWQLM